MSPSPGSDPDDPAIVPGPDDLYKVLIETPTSTTSGFVHAPTKRIVLARREMDGRILNVTLGDTVADLRTRNIVVTMWPRLN